MRRRVGVLAMIVVSLILYLPGSATGTEQFESTKTWKSCGSTPADVADGPEDCHITATVSRDGSVSAEAHLTSPANGYAPWDALMYSSGDVVTRHYVAQPVKELRFIATVLVKRASATIGPELTQGRTGWYTSIVNKRASFVSVGAAALHASTNECGGGTGASNVVYNFMPDSTESHYTSHADPFNPKPIHFPLYFDIVVRVGCSGGKNIPPGDLVIRAGAGAHVHYLASRGTASASVDAVVTGVTVSSGLEGRPPISTRPYN